MIVSQNVNEGGADVTTMVKPLYGMHDVSIQVDNTNNPPWLLTTIEFNELRDVLNKYHEKYMK